MTKRHVRGVLKSVHSSRVNFKPYGYLLDFDGGNDLTTPVLVDIELDAKYVIKDEKDCIVISLDGMNAILEATAESIDKLNNAYLKRMKED